MTANLFSRMIPLLHKAIPAGLALKGLSKVNPNLSNFATTALSSGYAADQILDYLRGRIGMSGDSEETERLENSGRALRPDEKRSLKKRKQNEAGKNIATAAIGAATGLAGMQRNAPNENQGRGIMPDEITQGQPQRPPMQLGGRQPLGITEQTQGIPQEGSTIIPPISPQQQTAAKKRTATQKFGKHQQKKKMVDELYDMYQAGKYPPEQGQQLNPEDQALIQAIQQALQM